MPARRSTNVALWRGPSKPIGGGRGAPAERAALDAAIAAVDGRVPCLDPARAHMWLSEADLEILVAQLFCRSCTVLRECRAYRRRLLPSFGVWAAVYYPKERPADDC